MNNPESVKIINRFYEALDVLISNRQLRGVKSFTDKYDINRWTLNNVRKDPKSDMFQLIWASHLIADFGVSADWLMTGKGWMFGVENPKFQKVVHKNVGYNRKETTEVDSPSQS